MPPTESSRCWLTPKVGILVVMSQKSPLADHALNSKTKCRERGRRLCGVWWAGRNTVSTAWHVLFSASLFSFSSEHTKDGTSWQTVKPEHHISLFEKENKCETIKTPVSSPLSTLVTQALSLSFFYRAPWNVAGCHFSRHSLLVSFRIPLVGQVALTLMPWCPDLFSAFPTGTCTATGVVQCIIHWRCWSSSSTRFRWMCTNFVAFNTLPSFNRSGAVCLCSIICSDSEKCGWPLEQVLGMRTCAWCRPLET